jgi:hypothetical protein
MSGLWNFGRRMSGGMFVVGASDMGAGGVSVVGTMSGFGSHTYTGSNTAAAPPPTPGPISV